MTPTLPARLNQALAAGLDTLQPLFALATRLWVAWQFLKSGILKAQDWESTLFLFQEEYRVPLLSPPLAALAGTAGELFFPVLLGLGLFGRFAALGLSAVNVLAVVSYAHVLLASGFEWLARRGVFSDPPLTRDQLRSLSRDNAADTSATSSTS